MYRGVGLHVCFDFIAFCQLVSHATPHSPAESGDPRPHTASPRLASDFLFWARFKTWKNVPQKQRKCPSTGRWITVAYPENRTLLCNLIHPTTDTYYVEDLTCRRETRLKELHPGRCHLYTKGKTKPWGRETNLWLLEAEGQGGGWLQRSRRDSGGGWKCSVSSWWWLHDCVTQLCAFIKPPSAVY